MVPLAMEDGDSRLSSMKTTFASSPVTAATLKAYRADGRWLPTRLHMHPGRSHDERTRHKGRLGMTTPLVNCFDGRRIVQGPGASNLEHFVEVGCLIICGVCMN